METPGRSWSERHEFSRSNVSNSTYSPFNIACLTLVGAGADNGDSRSLRDGRTNVIAGPGLVEKAGGEVVGEYQ